MMPKRTVNRPERMIRRPRVRTPTHLPVAKPVLRNHRLRNHRVMEQERQLQNRMDRTETMNGQSRLPKRGPPMSRMVKRVARSRPVAVRRKGARVVIPPIRTATTQRVSLVVQRVLPTKRAMAINLPPARWEMRVKEKSTTMGRLLSNYVTSSKTNHLTRQNPAQVPPPSPHAMRKSLGAKKVKNNRPAVLVARAAHDRVPTSPALREIAAVKTLVRVDNKDKDKDKVKVRVKMGVVNKRHRDSRANNPLAKVQIHRVAAAKKIRTMKSEGRVKVNRKVSHHREKNPNPLPMVTVTREQSPRARRVVVLATQGSSHHPRLKVRVKIAADRANKIAASSKIRSRPTAESATTNQILQREKRDPGMAKEKKVEVNNQVNRARELAVVIHLLHPAREPQKNLDLVRVGIGPAVPARRIRRPETIRPNRAMQMKGIDKAMRHRKTQIQKRAVKVVLRKERMVARLLRINRRANPHRVRNRANRGQERQRVRVLLVTKRMATIETLRMDPF